MSETKNKNYMYLIVIILCCLSILGTVGVPNAYSLFYTPMADSLNVGRAAIVFHTTISSLIYGFCVPFTPYLTKKFRIKRLFIFGLFLQLVICVLISLSKTVIMIDILSIVKGISNVFISTILLTTVIYNWFEKYRGTIVGIIFSFSGLGGAIMSQVFKVVLSQLGWQISYIIMGCATLIFALPFALFCPENPKQLGMKKFGEGEVIEKTKKSSYDLPLQINSKLFISITLLTVTFTSLICYSSHLTSYNLEKGFPSEVSANLLSVMMIGNVLFKFIIGLLNDKLGALACCAVTSFVSALSIVLFIINGTSPTLFILTGILYGAGYGLVAVGIPTIISHYYDGANYTKAYSNTTFITSVYSAIVLTLVGMAFDIFNSYNIPFIILLVIGLTSLPIIYYLYKTVDSKRK